MKRLLTMGAVAGSLALAACGGDDGPSKEEFAREADRICADFEKASDGLGSPNSVAEIGPFAEKASGEIDKVIQRLDELETPSGDEGEKAQQFIDAVKADAQGKIKPALAEMKTAAEKKDEQGVVAAAEKIQKIDTSKSDDLARQAGARGCAE
jgi:hypothetical protein